MSRTHLSITKFPWKRIIKVSNSKILLRRERMVRHRRAVRGQVRGRRQRVWATTHSVIQLGKGRSGKSNLGITYSAERR